MEGICGKRTYRIDADALAERLAGCQNILIDVGTGDGRYVLHAARTDPSRFAFGVDACRGNLRSASRGAPRNAQFVIADARALPRELHGLATQVTINFPWGSLLGGLLEGDSGLLGGLAAIARPGAALEVRLNGGALAELGWSLDAGGERIRQTWRAAGFKVGRPVELDARALRACPTTWAKRLAFGRDPRALHLGATVPLEIRDWRLEINRGVSISSL
jgi:16S rRNA (adenine(1408)-N(1))-methyltransferase